MIDWDPTTRSPSPGSTVEAFLLGQVDFQQCLALQKHLLEDTITRADGRISMLICEHPAIVTIGRAGSRDDVQLRGVQLASRQIDIYSVNRGGGAMLHLPGQLAVYPIVPLDWLGWNVGEYLARFQAGMVNAIEGLGLTCQTHADDHGIWGNSGQLVHFGVAVQDWTTYFGAVVNVRPALNVYQYIDTDPVGHTPIGSLSNEKNRSVSMTRVRSRVVRSVSEAFSCEQYHLYTGHPMLGRFTRAKREAAKAAWA